MHHLNNYGGSHCNYRIPNNFLLSILSVSFDGSVQFASVKSLVWYLSDLKPTSIRIDFTFSICIRFEMTDEFMSNDNMMICFGLIVCVDY